VRPQQIYGWHVRCASSGAVHNKQSRGSQRPHRTSGRRRTGYFAPVALGCLVLALVGFALLIPNPETGGMLDLEVASPVDGRDSALPELAAADRGTSDRPVYRHSVIPGGVYSGTELADAVDRDPVIAREYGGLANRPIQVRTVTAPRMAYVSYRVGDRVYWTKNKVQLKVGEQVLTDGVTEIRARCGNCISLQPLQPTSDNEPDLAELDRLEPGDGLPVAAATRPPIAASTLAQGLIAPPNAGLPGFESNIGGSSPPESPGNSPSPGVPVGGPTSVISTRGVPPLGPSPFVPPDGGILPGPPTFAPPGDGTPPTSNQPPGANPPGDFPPGGNPPGGNPPGGNPPGGSPPGDNPPGGNPPGDNPPDDNPPGGNPPGDNPPDDNPPGDGPPDQHTVPEPQTLLLFTGGAAAWLLRRYRRRV
jgi:hypothetical protein